MADIIYGGSGKNWVKVGYSWVNDSPEGWASTGWSVKWGFGVPFILLGLLALLLASGDEPLVRIIGIGLLVSGVLHMFSRIFRIIFWSAVIIAAIGVVVWLIIDFMSFKPN